MLDILLMGDFQVRLNGRSLSFRTKKVQALLAYLVVEAKEFHRREALMTLLWPDLPAKAAQTNLRSTLYQLRQSIPDVKGIPFILSDRRKVEINPSAEFTCDVQHFRQLSTTNPADLEQATALYRGDFLSGFYLPDSELFEEWSGRLRATLHQQIQDNLHQLTAHYLENGSYNQALLHARRQVTLDNLRENAHRQLMLALAGQGNRSAALAHYDKCRDLLAEELGVEPELATIELVEQIKHDRQQLPVMDAKTAPRVLTDQPERPKPPPPHNLPFNLTRIIGRDGEIAELTHLLLRSPQRLITLVGVGGIGKTRLATAVAHAILSGIDNPFQDGIFFVSLATTTNVENIVSAVAQAIEIHFVSDSRSPQQQLQDYLHHKKMLLVIDNFEQLQEGFPILLDLLHVAAGLKILVTSREALGIQGEQYYPLKGLSYPQKLSDMHKLTAYGAPTLFIERATNLNPEFFVNDKEIKDLLQICSLTDGMPLALELAVVWCNTITLAEIAESIERNLDFLEASWRDLPNRHHNIRAVFEASWQRMSLVEQIGFMKLSIFRGGFTRQAAQFAADVGTHQLKSLLTRSMLLFDRFNARYQMQPLLRQYAVEKLHLTQDIEQGVLNRHCAFFCDFLQQCEGALKSERQLVVVEKLQMENENIQLAWNWAIKMGNYQNLSESMDSLGIFYGFWGANLQTGERLFRQALTNLLVPQTEQETWIANRLKGWLMELSSRAGNSEMAQLLRQELIAYLRKNNVGSQESWPKQSFLFWQLGNTSHSREEAVNMYQKSLALAQKYDELWEKALVLQMLGSLSNLTGNQTEGKTYWQESLSISRQLGERMGIAGALQGIAETFWQEYQLEEARQSIHESIALYKSIGDKFGYCYALGELSWIQLLNGDFEQALKSSGECESIYHELGSKPGVAHARVKTGNIFLHLGNFSESKQLAEANYQLVQESSLPFFRLVQTLANLGAVSLVNQKYKEANEYLQKATKLCQEANIVEPDDNLILIFSLSAIASLQIDEFSLARRYLVDSLTAASIAQPSTIHFVLASAALFFLSLGRKAEAVACYAVVERTPFAARSAWFKQIAGNTLKKVAAQLDPSAISIIPKTAFPQVLWQTAESLLQELSSPAS